MANRYPVIVTNTGAGDDAPFAFKEIPSGDDLLLTGNFIRIGSTSAAANVIKDANGNAVISFPSAVASAVNYFRLNNSATGSSIVLEAVGGDTDVSIHLKPKGSNGEIIVGTGAAAAAIETSGNQDLVLRTGNSLTGSLTLTQGNNGNLTFTPVGTGKLKVGANDVVTTGDTGTVTSTMIFDGTIVNGDINASAAIAYSKLSLSNSIVNADINASAAIAHSKLETSTSSTISCGNIELGHATDTTLSRSGVGVLAVEGVVVPTVSSTNTLTNKTITSLLLTAGTATAGTAPLKFNSGTNLTTVEAGAVEYDGVNMYVTSETASGRKMVVADNHFHLSSGDGTTITATTITDAFASATIALAASAYYEIEWHMYWVRSTAAGTHTYTVVTSQTPTFVTVGGVNLLAPGTVGQMAFGTTTSTALAASASMSVGNHYHIVKAWVLMGGTAGTVKLQVTSSANGITLKRGSHIKALRVPTANVGVWA